MCGRFAITLPRDAMAQLFAARPANDLPQVPNYNVCPTNHIHAVLGDGAGARQLVALRWGFVPHWYAHPGDGPLLINARAETIAQKPAFSAACRTRRCLIPVSGYYEWTKDAEGARLPWYIQPATGTAPLVLAGIWQDWGSGAEALRSCAIVTTASGPGLAALHHREPVALAPQDWPLWLGEAGHGAARLMRAAPQGAMRWHRVDRRVNSNRASGPALIDPLAES